MRIHVSSSVMLPLLGLSGALLLGSLWSCSSDSSSGTWVPSGQNEGGADSTIPSKDATPEADAVGPKKDAPSQDSPQDTGSEPDPQTDSSPPDSSPPGPECATMTDTPIDIPVIVLIYNPTLPNHGNKKLIDAKNWSDPEALTATLVSDVKKASCGFVRYNIVDKIEVDGFPRKLDGFQYDEASWWKCMDEHSTCHMPDDVDYAAIFDQNQLANKISTTGASEVWIWGAPYFGTDEYAMKIPSDAPYDNPNCQKPEAYWFYRPKNIPDLGKTVWVMGFSYERAEGEMVESYGHRIEGILSISLASCIWSSTGTDPWSKFTWVDKNVKGQAQCGGIHYAPNSTTDYDWANQNSVPSACDDWYQYPSLAGNYQSVNCTSWGCEGHAYKVWWMSHLPHSPGAANNWWRYIADYDNANK